jgi:hypothetical protein
VAVLDAAFAVWFCGRSENEQAPTGQQKEEFRASLAALTDWDLTDPGRIVGAAQYATYFDINTIAEALRSTDRDRVWRAWFTAWPRTYVPGDTGDPWDSTCIGGPSDEAMEQVGEQIDKLLDAEVYVGRLERAASHAGIHKSARIYHGLDVDELKVTGVDLWRSRASELWRVAYTASGEVEPTKDETSRFFASLNSIGYDGEFCVADVYVAASAAGRYQDPDLTTCLPRRLSALEAAAQPLGGAA